MQETLMTTAKAAYRLDGALVPREQFYRVACDPGRSVVVEACAGAGKTWMLVSRILRALLDGTAPQEIVAITFTRKAAGEMRDRLNDWLREFSAAHSTPQARIQALVDRGMGEEQAQQGQALLGGLHAQMLSGGRGVEIRTFHAWFSQLLRAAPMELLQQQGLAPELQLIEDETDLMPELWQRFYGRVLADTALLADYQSLVTDRGRGTVMNWLYAAFSKRVELQLADKEGVLTGSMPDASGVGPEFAGLVHPVEHFEFLRPLLGRLAPILGAGKNKTMQNAGGALERALALAGDTQAAYIAVREALFTATGTPRKHLGDCAELAEANHAIERLLRAIAQHEAWVEHQAMVRLSRVLLGEYEALKGTRGLVDMNDLERGALALLADADLSGWVQERLDARVRHVLIDEFQDTSPLQWHALYGWLSSYSGAGGGFSGQKPPAVFIVGDPKQSIYRFRRAEPRVFAAARAFVVQGLDGAVLECDHTRRNAPPVLAAVNSVFTAAAEEGAYAGFRVHTTEVGAPGMLDGLFVLQDAASGADAGDDDDGLVWRPSLTTPRQAAEEHRRAAEAHGVAHAVLALVRDEGVAPGQIFVLARRRDPLRVLAQALKALGLPHAAPEDTPLLDVPDVRDLLALLDVLASRGHTLSLAHALRSPLLGVGEDDLLAIADAAREAESTWWSALMKLEEGSEALMRARQLLQRWAQLARRLPPHDLLDRIVFEGNLMARLAAAVPPSERRQRLAAVDALLALVLDLDGGRYPSVYKLVRALRKRALKLSWPSEPDAVQLLTVHGAKGLEAPVVFMMDCDPTPTRAETATLAVDWPVQAAAPRRVAFLASEARCPPSLADLLEDERKQRAREELNGLYVAMTRARSRLVISRTPSRRGETPPGNWWDRLSPLATPWTPGGDTAGAWANATHCSLPTLPPLTARPTLRVDADPDAAAMVPVADTAVLGEALHRVLEWACGPQGAVRPFGELVAAAGHSFGLNAKQQQSLARASEAIWNSPACQPFFDAAQLEWAGNEVAINLKGQDLRMDRLVCRLEHGRRTWWVLDYKLHSAPDTDAGYREQLWRYREAMQGLQAEDAVRCAFITSQGRLIELQEF